MKYTKQENINYTFQNVSRDLFVFLTQLHCW